ncbi:MAG TPA: acyltransferase [Leptospiraceae bacterium]|nr:acyltransferase [Leptospiraceae bacterium]HMW03716.1 acyltransferase [Leptospiraceae bacterium]HMX31829.1 acyltransferase [Leptospiraceae bacterium]HMY29696.1 acyltransferase [Leptospiraceae bacterium]HMZ64028.1 acyltransferase [Leptospiraceae bacterium]
MIQTTNLYIEFFGLILLLILLVSFQSFRNLFTFSNSPPEKKGERSRVVDFVRGVAMCAIVVIHVDSYFTFFHPKDSELILSKLMANFSRFCVPAFIFSSGFFLSWKGFSAFWNSKIKNLLIPYLIIACIGFFTKYPAESFLSDIIPKLLLGQVFQPYYYVPLLFSFYLLYSLFFRNIQNWSANLFYLVLILSLLINVWSNHSYPKSLPYIGGMEAISFTNYLFFFVSGFSAKRLLTNKNLFLDSLSANRYYFQGLVITILIYLSVVTYYTVDLNLEISNHFLFYPIACFIVFTLIGIRLESTNQTFLKKIYSVFVFIGENSLALFLLHPMTIHLMHMLDPYYMGGFYLGWIFTFAINIILPLLVWKMAYGIIDKFSEKK